MPHESEPRLPFMAFDPNMRVRRKFRGLLAKLPGERPRDVLGSLACLWSSVFNESPGGDVSRWSDEEIAFAAEWHGDPAAFVAALRAGRWIDADGRIHDWCEWGGYLFRVRKTRAEQKAAERERRKAQAQQYQEDREKDGGVSRDMSSDVVAKSGTTKPNGTEPNQTERIPPTPFAPDGAGGSSRGASPRDLLRTWNENRGHLPEAKSLPPGRERHARAALIREPNLDRWAAAVRRFATPHAAEWSWASFDFLLRPDSLTKIEEGKYDRPFGGNGSSASYSGTPSRDVLSAANPLPHKPLTPDRRKALEDADREIEELRLERERRGIPNPPPRKVAS